MMKLSFSFIRILFLGLCILIFMTYATALATKENYYINLSLGALIGLAVGFAVLTLDRVFKHFNLRALNTATIGLFCGYLLGNGIVFIFNAVINIQDVQVSPLAIDATRALIYLLCVYFAMVMTMRASDELYLSIPFIKFKSSTQKKKDLILDLSALYDSRIIDLAASGLFDHHLVLAQFLMKELSEMMENSDEAIRSKARRCLDVIKKLEAISSLELRYIVTDFPDIKDSMTKLVRLARLVEANILTADSNRPQQPIIDGVRIINIHVLFAALKPLAQAGEYINIKIQRYGKEPRQGIGYLDDGTMVVVNGGAEFLGEMAKAQVLSVKHTSSGRMVFSNAIEDAHFLDSNLLATNREVESANLTKNSFAL